MSWRPVLMTEVEAEYLQAVARQAGVCPIDQSFTKHSSFRVDDTVHRVPVLERPHLSLQGATSWHRGHVLGAPKVLRSNVVFDRDAKDGLLERFTANSHRCLVTQKIL